MHVQYNILAYSIALGNNAIHVIIVASTCSTCTCPFNACEDYKFRNKLIGMCVKFYLVHVHA